MVNTCCVCGVGPPVEAPAVARLPAVEQSEHQFLTLEEAADFLRTSVPTLRRWTAAGKVPRAAAPGRRPLYSRLVLLELLERDPNLAEGD